MPIRLTIASSTWLGAGKSQGRQPISLYEASHVARSSAQIVRRRRTPVSFVRRRRVGGSRFVGGVTFGLLRIDTRHLVFDFPADPSRDGADVVAVKVARVRQQ